MTEMLRKMPNQSKSWLQLRWRSPPAESGEGEEQSYAGEERTHFVRDCKVQKRIQD